VCSSDLLNQGDNVEEICAEVRAAKRRFSWLNMIVFGELAARGAKIEDAEPAGGPVETAFQAVARETGLWLVPGSYYERDGDRVFNTSPVIAPNGDIIARYRKMFPFRPYEKGVTSGDQFVVFDVPGAGRFGVSNCYDMWFPETTRTMAWLGAEVILHPGMTNTIDRDVELSIARASAATNQCYFVDVNVAGRLGVGRSVVVGPGGEVIHQAREGRELIAVDIDFDYVRRVRERGWQGLGQPLKSFRESTVQFPPYEAIANSSALERLGPLEIPSVDGNQPDEPTAPKSEPAQAPGRTTKR